MNDDPRCAPVRFPEHLSDKDIAAFLDFLQELTLAFEQHYAGQLYRHYRGLDERQAQLWDEDNPPF